MSALTVLVVDDEPNIRRALRVWLEQHDYEVILAATGEEALDLAATRSPDVVILDLVLPDISGLEVCRGLREWSQAPVIVLSAKGEERDKIEALDHGADDYLTKPFGMGELLARIRAVLRRVDVGSASPVLRGGDLQLDQVKRLVTISDREVHLTPTEYEMLRFLMANAGKVLTHSTLLRTIWGPSHEDASETLRVFIAQLRRKIEPEAHRPMYIRTEPGIGYRFREP
jgi:two-component system KDP operon response regulator KdpE